MDNVTLEQACVGIVGLIALNLATKALSHLYKTFLRPAKDLKKLGKWAVITGATGKFILQKPASLYVATKVSNVCIPQF